MTPASSRGNCWWRVLCQRSSRDSSYTSAPNVESQRWWRRVNNQWQPTATIRLRERDICTGGKGDCHIYVDQINLNRSKLFIENGSRPVVIHLLGAAQGATNGQPSASGTVTLGANALICGVDVGSTTCNDKPERLIITTDHTITRSLQHQRPSSGSEWQQSAGRMGPDAPRHRCPCQQCCGPWNDLDP